jgi:hypothetical protein
MVEIRGGVGRSGWVKVASAVRSSVVVVVNIFGEYCTQVALVDDQHAVGQFGSQGAYKPFGEAVGPRRQLHLIPTIGIAASG